MRRKKTAPDAHKAHTPFLEVDCSDGEMELALWGAINDFHRIDGGRFLGRAIPCYGVESSSRLLRYYDLKPGEWRRQRKTNAGFDWIENAHARRAVSRGFSNVYASLTYDANTAKTRRDSAWKLPIDRDGTATLFDNRSNEEELMQFCRRQTAEDFIAVRKSGIEYRRWKMKKPKVSDNEFLDTDAACRALAEYVGCSEQIVGENVAPDARSGEVRRYARVKGRGVRRY